ncbi:MAG: hypothetical protein HY670_03800 [Chloroflexi bacterium]|nr:hypothetical protein [Chloroflexota bacterium]
MDRSALTPPALAEDVCPLLVGAAIPEVTLLTADEAPFDLKAATARKPAIIIFYRGGW